MTENRVCFSKKILDYISTLCYPGIYMFTDIDNKPLYIGSSKNLSIRILTSFKENIYHNQSYDKSNLKPIKIFYIKTTSESDARIMEILHIVKTRPILNTEFNIEDKPSYNLEESTFNLFGSWKINSTYISEH